MLTIIGTTVVQSIGEMHANQASGGKTIMRGNVLQTIVSGNLHRGSNFTQLDFIGNLGGVFRWVVGAALLVASLAGMAAAQLTITAPIPATQTANAGDTVIFTVNVSGQQAGRNYQYIWQFSPSPSNPDYVPIANGGRFSGVSGPTLVITNAQATDNGRFRCLLNETDSTGAYTANLNSGPGYLTVNVPPPPTVTQPVPQTAIRGSGTSFSVSATGQGTLIYQWQVSSPAGVTFANLNDDGRITGSATATLQIASTLPGDAGWYRCLVSNAGGPTNSGRATLTVLASPPANLTATAFSSTAINLSWTNTDPDAAYVVIERALGNSGAFSLLVQASAQLTSYQDSQAAPATAYTYRAYAMYSTDSLTGMHAYSNQTSATTMAATLPPTGLLATPVTSSQINLTWTNQDPTATTVVIERQALTTGAGTPFVQIASLTGSPLASTYQDNNNGSGLPSQTAFNYRAYAVSPRGNSVYSNTSETTTLAPPPTPISFQATTISAEEIDLSWNDSDPTVQSYVIERQAAGGTYQQIAAPMPGSNHFYQDLTVTPATQYNYRMYAVSPTGNSAYTAPVSATTVPAPPAPTQIYANPVSTTQIDLSWKNPPGNLTIQIEREKTQNPPFREIGTVVTSAPPVFHDQNLDPATTYLYRVRAVDASGSYSAYSDIAINSTLVPVPTNLTSTSHTAPLINLQWTNPFNGYTKLHLYQNGPNDGVRFLVADLDGNTTSYQFNVALPNTSYSFALQAEVSGKLSAFTSDLVVMATGRVTIFFVHGANQSGGMLQPLADALKTLIDPTGATYNFDTGFDWSRCAASGSRNQRFPYTPFPAGEDLGVVPPPPPAPYIPLIPGFPPNPCPNKCNVSDAAYDLAHYIARQNPPGDVFVVAYSMGGNVARDMIEGQPESNIGTPGHKLLGLVTLASGNNGYPYEYPWDNLAICDGLGKEVASDIRSSPANYPYSNYIPSINTNWLASPLGGAGYQSFPWMVAAGTFCKSPIRFPDSTQNGCPAGSSNDGLVCADSALLNGVPGGSFNRPTSVFASDLYSHSRDIDPAAQLLVFNVNNGDASAFYNGSCNMGDHLSMWNPGAGSSLAQQLASFIQANTP